MVNTQSSGIDLKSMLIYGIHGALGLFTGIGLLMLILLIFGLSAGIIPGLIVVFVIYGAYVGYIFGGQRSSSRLAKMGVIAGPFCGIVASFYLDSVVSYPVIVAIAGLIFGLPGIKNMVTLSVSGASGGAIGYGVYVLGENIIYLLNNSGMRGSLLIPFIALFFFLLAIGIAGASIATGMYFARGTAYTRREIPRFLKIARNTGIALTVLVLFYPSIILVSIAHYASTSESVHIEAGNEKTILYVPVLLDENGEVLEMFEKPAITGNATTAIIDTDYGKALKISGSGVIGINMRQTHGIPEKTQEATEKFMNGFTISTSDSTHYGDIKGSQTVDIWVYSEDDGTGLSFSVSRDNGWGAVLSLYTEEHRRLTEGWQVVRLSGGTIMYD